MQQTRTARAELRDLEVMLTVKDARHEELAAPAQLAALVRGEHHRAEPSTASMKGFHSGKVVKSVSVFHTRAGGASISISAWISNTLTPQVDLDHARIVLHLLHRALGEDAAF